MPRFRKHDKDMLDATVTLDVVFDLSQFNSLAMIFLDFISEDHFRCAGGVLLKGMGWGNVRSGCLFVRQSSRIPQGTDELDLL